jgi:preprotein translocase subunit SecD
MALQMHNGGLQYKYDISNGVSITSPYGADVALKCAVAIIVLAVLLMAALIVLYKGFGVIAALSSLLFILAEGWLLIGVPGIVLSMGGVVGILAAIVLNAIGMVILAGKIKDEFKNSEKTAKAAVSKGFKDALVPTINVNVVAGLFGLALLIFAKGAVKGFAITFGIGAVVALVATLVFTRMFNVLIFPLVKNKETFLGKKQIAEETAVTEEA